MKLLDFAKQSPDDRLRRLASRCYLAQTSLKPPPTVEESKAEDFFNMNIPFRELPIPKAIPRPVFGG